MSRRRDGLLLVVLCAALFVASLFAFSRHDDFPYYCHHDEPVKVAQLITRDFNFHHPQLLLHTTDLVRRARGLGDGYQQVVMAGRAVSATFAAASVVLLALLGWRAFGLLGAFCVGLSVAVCPILGLTAHFLKEDTSLLLGVSAFLLAFQLWREQPTVRRLLWLGLACGLAASTKYVGALCVVPAVVLVSVTRCGADGSAWHRRLALLLLPALLVFLAINHPLFTRLDAFTLGIKEGAVLIAEGRRPMDLPNLTVFAKLTRLSWQVSVLAGVGVFALFAAFRRANMVAGTVLGTGLAFTGMLLLTPLGVPDRYLLLPAVCLHALAGLGIALLVEFTGRAWTQRARGAARMIGAVASLGLVWVASPVYRDFAVDAFDRADARAELIEWVNTTLGDDDALSASLNIRLPGVGGLQPASGAIRFDTRPVTLEGANDLDSDKLDALRLGGFTHVILRDSEFNRLVDRIAVRQAAEPDDARPMSDATSRSLDVVWRTPERYANKNRWLGNKMVVVRL